MLCEVDKHLTADELQIYPDLSTNV